MEFHSSHKQRKSRPLMLRLIGTVVALAVVIYLIWQNWSDFITNLQRLHFSYILAILGLAFFSRLMKTMRWFYLIKVVEKQTSFWVIFKLSFVGLFSSNILPSTIGGDVVKMAGAVNGGMDPAGVTASLILDRMIGMIAMATFLPWGILTTLQLQTPITGSLFAGVGGFLKKALDKLKAFLQRTWSILKKWSKQPTSLVIATILSYCYSFSTFAIVYLILTGLGESISWWTAGGLWVFIYFITLLPISINGLGLQEASLSFVFVTFAGISEPNSLVLAVLTRIVFVIASLPGALFLPAVMSGVRNSTKNFINSKN
jgi:glycosyltransferase 2 family protein